jgi:hypothetical protein
VVAISPWRFSITPAHARRPHVVLFAFGRGGLADDVELSLSRFGAPSAESLDACSVRTIARGADPAWFDGWRSGSLRSIAEKDLGGDIAVLDAADYVHVIACDPSAVADLTYLQAAWALARYLVARGAAIVLDAHAMSFKTAAMLQPAGEPLDVRREVSVIYETDSTRADRAHALHTRGLRKFGAPDLVALCTDADVPLVAHSVNELADTIARGTDLSTPKHAVEISPGLRWVAIEDEHHLGELLQLNNEARVLVDENGHDLMGVMARLPRIVS